MSRLPRVFLGLLGAGFLLAARGGVASADPPRAPTLAGELARTDVVLDTQVPLRAGRNVVWCAATSLAWKALADVVGPLAGTPGEVRLGPPAPAELVAAMNRNPFPRTSLDPESFLAFGGFARDGIGERIRSAVAAKFGADAPLPTLDLHPTDVVGYARLQKDLRFELAFDVRTRPLRFLGGPARIHGFGHDGDSPERGLGRQVVLHRAAVAEPQAGYSSPWRGVVELLPTDTSDRILLSSLPSRPTLEETWQAVVDRLATGREDRICSSTDLAIPRIRLDSDHSFAEFDGAPVVGVDGMAVREFRQHLSFALTEKGATLIADVSMAAAECEAIGFEGPFLLALIRRGALRPYFLVWIGNEDLLEKDEFRPLDAKALEPFVGTWTLDRATSLQEAIERLSDDAPPDRTPTQAHDDARRTIGDRFERMSETLKIGPDGRARWTRTVRPAEPSAPPQAQEAAGHLLSLPAGVALVFGESGADEARAVSIQLEEGLLRLRRPEGATVLRR